jgi:hypothetical protein
MGAGIVDPARYHLVAVAATLDIALVLAEAERQVMSACPDDLELARRTIARLPPENWALEWQLPWWLGEAFGVAPEASLALSVANVLGLVSIRLGDDLADGELEPADLRDATRLREATYQAAIDIYRSRFDSTSPFWVRLDESMAAWRRAANEPAEARLAARGAPLKVGAFGVTLLGGRQVCWPILERCLDHALTAMVLYDHFLDWEADLRAGRWNAFVAATSSRPQAPENVEANRASVLTAMMVGGVVEAHFGRVLARATAAARLADTLDVTSLSSFLVDYGDRIAEQGTMVEAHYRTAGDRAAEVIFRR